jgi:hypothetical protein
MATVQEVRYTDDLTGKQLDSGTFRTVRLVVDDRAYELHLSPSSAAELEQALAPFIGNAASGKAKPPAHTHRIGLPTQRPAVDRERRRAIRVWLVDNWRAAGLDPPSNKGRIPRASVDAYHRYGGGTVPQPAPKGRSK